MREYINKIAQEFRERTVQREHQYTIIDPGAIAEDKRRKINITLYVGEESKEEERKLSDYRLLISWVDSGIKIFEKKYDSLDKAIEDYQKYDSLIKMLHILVEENDLIEAEERAKEILDMLKKDTEKIIEETKEPSPTTQASRDKVQYWDLTHRIYNIMVKGEDPESGEKFPKKVTEDDIHAMFKEKGWSDEAIDIAYADVVQWIIDDAMESSIKEGNILIAERQRSDDEYDAEELKKGIEIEQEHLDTIKELIIELGKKPEDYKELIDKVIKNITKDHLDEIKDYNTRLLKMEKEANGGENE